MVDLLPNSSGSGVRSTIVEEWLKRVGGSCWSCSGFWACMREEMDVEDLELLLILDVWDCEDVDRAK
jgi:hypothetical protein